MKCEQADLILNLVQVSEFRTEDNIKPGAGDFNLRSQRLTVSQLMEESTTSVFTHD